MRREVKIGLFAVVMLLCAWGGIRFLSGIDIFGRNVTYYASYDKVNGINNASPILIQGVKVGMVTEIIFDPQVSDQITLKLSIKQRYRIPQDTKAKIYSTGLMSAMGVGLEMGESSVYLAEGDTLSSYYEEGLMDVAASKLLGVVESVTQASEELNVALDNINELFEENRGSLGETLNNLSSISHNLDVLLAEQQQSVAEAIVGFSEFSATLGRNSQSIENIISNLNTLSEELSEAEVGTSLNSTIAELNEALSKVNRAEGSVGQMLNDEELYRNLTDVSSSLNSLIVDMQSNPKRYVHFSLFGGK